MDSQQIISQISCSVTNHAGQNGQSSATAEIHWLNALQRTKRMSAANKNNQGNTLLYGKEKQTALSSLLDSCHPKHSSRQSSAQSESVMASSVQEGM